MAKVPATISQITSKVPTSGRAQVKAVLEEVSPTGWLRPEKGEIGFNWPANMQGTYKIFLSEGLFKKIQEVRPDGKIKGKKSDVYEVILADRKVSFQQTGKQGAGGADAKTTAAQERGSAYILKRALNQNRKYNSAEDIKKDATAYRELQKIWKQSQLEFDDDWLSDYYKQQKRMLQEYSNPKFTEFTRDGGFMDWITKLVNEKYQISKKDNWNPADIWLIQNEQKVIKQIQDLVDGGTTQTLQELNAILRTLFKDEIVVGVSLKKVSGGEAYYEKVNVNTKDFESYKQMYFTISEVKCDLSLGKDKKGRTSFGTQDSRVFVDGPKTTYNFQIKANDSSGLSNLKWEPTASGQAAARLGKAPVDMVKKLMIDYGIRFDNKNGQYPKSLPEFMDDQEDYAKMIQRLSKKGVDFVDEKKAINNIAMVFGTENYYVANSKLMQIKFLDVLYSLNEKERNQFMTDMTFLAQKKGERFGPFGKLY